MQFVIRSIPLGDTAVVQQQVNAVDSHTLRQQMQAAGHTILSIDSKSTTPLQFGKSKRHDFPLFCKEVRTLIRAGMTVVEAVDTLSRREGVSNKEESLTVQLRARLEQGQALSSALEGLDGTPPVLVAAVRAGERTSNLGEALDDYLRFDGLVVQLKRKVISASIYPALVTTLGIAISLFLLMIVMPNFSRMYDNLRGNARGSTALMINASQFLSTHRMEAFFYIALLFVVVAWWIKSGTAKHNAMNAARAIPWLRTRIEDFELAMMYQALALLLKGGYVMTQAMDVAGQSALSDHIRSALSEVLGRVEQGGSVAQAMAAAGLCDEVGRRLMAAAERNGDFHMAADVVSRMHSERFELFVERLTRIVEPLLLLLVATMVGAIVVMMYMPIFDMATKLR
jgi:general secretion pathway protein F